MNGDNRCVYDNDDCFNRHVPDDGEATAVVSGKPACDRHAAAIRRQIRKPQ